MCADVADRHFSVIDGGRLVDAGRVAMAYERIPSAGETDRLAEWFRVLGDPTRTRILYALLEAGELCVSDLAAAIDTAESTVSHALRWLRSSRAVRSRRAGRLMYYSLDDSHVRMLLDLGREHLRHRDERG
jgi:ArsR family transcriptional regulator, lead/cadmium/zinc/bismuth-responsive transcriptional repressor